MRVLLVEDDPRMVALLRQGLAEEGYVVTTASDGRTGLDVAMTGDFEIIVLDVMLPGVNGYEIARRLRQKDCRTPILMLTARDSVPDIVEGLNRGADDYLTKPFSFEVLLARLRALIRRGPVPRPVVMQVADLVLNPATREVSRGGRAIALTRTEYGLLEFLMRRPGQVISRTTLIDAVWGFEREIETNTLDAFISLLRAKVDSGRRTKLIHTVRGVGYMLKEDRD
ncbi:MAG: response regulator transcription factor [Bacillota bacterium]